jgi:hypothetical protein
MMISGTRLAPDRNALEKVQQGGPGMEVSGVFRTFGLG